MAAQENNMKIVGIILGIILLGSAIGFAVKKDVVAIPEIESQPVQQEVIPETPAAPTPDKEPVEEDNSKFTSQFFKNISDTIVYDHASVPAIAPSITGDVEVDAYICTKVEARGYMRRAVAESESRLVTVQAQRLQPEVSASLKQLQAAAKKEGMNITLVSGYRSPDYQRGIFTKKLGTYDKQDLLGGKLDAKIDSILMVSSAPGYSKHHSGYTFDIGCNNYELTNAFMQTSCYKWLAKDNFKNARLYNFIPSYPVGIATQGPDPESWEFIWVPSDLLK